MMKNFKLFLAAPVLLTTILAGCKKDNVGTEKTPSTPVEQFTDLNIPDGFDFEGFKQVDLDLHVENPGFSNPFLIEVYDFLPTAGGEIIYSGYTTEDKLSAKVNMPPTLDHIYIVKKDPTGSSTLEKLAVVGNSISHKFGKKTGSKKTVPNSPNCSNGCDVLYTDENNPVNINKKDGSGVYCFSGNTTGNINVNTEDVTIRICGTADIHNLSLGNNCTLVISNDAVVEVFNLNLNSGSSMIVYEADLTVANNLTPNGPVTNYGNITVEKSFNINNGCDFVNNGTVNVADHLNNNQSLENNAFIYVDGDCNLNGSSATVNMCKIIVGGKLHFNNTAANHGYIEAAENININGGSSLVQHNGAMLYGKSNSHINSWIDGQGSTSLVKFDGDLNMNGGSGLSGNLELCVGGSFNNNGNVQSPATVACDQVYIPTSGCNPTGNGTPAVADDDTDGIPNDLDNYPNDGLRAGDSYYPSQNGFNTFLFEDLWPAAGDYDFNDMVTAYRFHYITNANNEIVDIEVIYSVRAIGAGLKNGFGIELNVAPSEVEGVTRSVPLNTNNLVNIDPDRGTELAQSKAVVIFYTIAQDMLPNPGTPFINTTPGAAYQQPDTATVKITFATAQDPSQLGEVPYNPFIFVGQDRGREVHLVGKRPTDLAEPNFFGTKGDNSDPSSNRYYVNENNLPWALNLPLSFVYPNEKTDIILAYPNVVQWAQSGGTNNSDWFLPSNAVSSHIYNKP